MAADLPTAAPQASTGTTSRPLTCVTPSPHHVFVARSWYRNINLFSIDYAFRPRLRFRLTLGGITFPRKPWVFGEQDSHLFYRYSCRHSHFHVVQPSLRSTFNLMWNAPLPSLQAAIRGFGVQLSPVYFRRRPARPVSCYALFK